MHKVSMTLAPTGAAVHEVTVVYGRRKMCLIATKTTTRIRQKISTSAVVVLLPGKLLTPSRRPTLLKNRNRNVAYFSPHMSPLVYSTW